MGEIASRGQIRMGQLRWGLVTAPLVLLLGGVSGVLSGMGGVRGSVGWYAALAKPSFMPPSWAFGAVWPILYILIGIALALVLSARGAPLRGPAVALFVVQLALNLAWAPLFFAMHRVTLAFWWIVALIVAAAVTTWLFGRVRRAAGALMLPYLAWLLFAALLNLAIDRLNPDAETLAPGGPSTQIQL